MKLLRALQRASYYLRPGNMHKPALPLLRYANGYGLQRGFAHIIVCDFDFEWNCGSDG